MIGPNSYHLLSKTRIIFHSIMSEVEIILQVAADELFNATITSKDQLPTYCCLINGTVKPPSADPLIDFYTIVNPGDKVSWEGKAVDKPNLCIEGAVALPPDNYRVNIDSISFQLVSGEDNFFEADPIVLFDPGNSGKITKQQMKSSGLSVGSIYTYTINFRIIKGNEDKLFFIDPKLEIPPR